MNITETFQLYVRPTDDGDGRWLYVDADSGSPSTVTLNVCNRNVMLTVLELRALGAIAAHLLAATAATEASTIAAVAAEFA